MSTASNGRSASGLRIAAFHVEPEACLLVRDWAADHGHEIVLLVTTPGPPPRTYQGYREIVASAPARQDILISTRFRRAASVIAAARPDLILSYTFPYRLPDEVLAIAPLGAVNLHPAPLPRFRGPNPHRMIFDGEPTIGAALHRMVPAFDAGAILSVHEAPLPADPTVDSVRELYDELIVSALDEGVERAMLGDPGRPQDEGQASYAAGFSGEDLWLDWHLPAEQLRRRAVALNLVETRARGVVDGARWLIASVEPAGIGANRQPAIPGTTLVGDRIVTLQAGDGPVRVTLGGPADDPAPSALPASMKAPRHSGLPVRPIRTGR